MLFGLGIRHVGSTVAKILVKQFNTIEKIINASVSELVLVDEIGDKIANSVHSYFSRKENFELIVNLQECGLNFVLSSLDVKKSAKLQGMNIIVSGVFEDFTREELKTMIEEHGGKNMSSISKNTTFVLAGNSMGPNKKQKAEDLGIPILYEEEFLEKLS